MDAKGVSGRDLARRADVSHRAVARWLEGSYPSLDIAVRLARALGVTLDELAGV